MDNTLALESKNNKRGMRISVGVHLLLLLFAFFYLLPQVDLDELDEKPPYAVKVDFTFEESSMSKYAHEDAGAQRPKAEAVKTVEPIQPKEIEVVKPDIKIPTPTEVTPVDPVTTSTTVDESPVKVIETTKPPITRNPVIVPAPKVVIPSPPTPTTTPSTSTTGTSTTKPSTIEGKEGGTGKGDSGTGAGKTKGNDGDEGLGNSSDGTGAYDGSGDGVFGRRVIYRDTKAALAAMTTSGTVVVKICVNRAGIVTYTEINESESTIRDKRTLRNFMIAAKGYKVQPDYTAPKEQCGKLVFKSDASQVNKLRGQ